MEENKIFYLCIMKLVIKKSTKDKRLMAVFSEPNKKDNVGIRTGLVHEAVLNDFESFENFQVYSCGPPILIETAYSTLLAKGLFEDDFFADAFTFAPQKK